MARESGFRLKCFKCVFQAPEVIYLGHRITRDGIYPIEEKVKTIQDSARPTNLKELKAFWGMLNYYSCYIPNVTSILTPLHKLLAKDTPWEWSDIHEESWNKAKSALHSSKVLVHCSLERNAVIACDASPYGLVFVISHILVLSIQFHMLLVHCLLQRKNTHKLKKKQLPSCLV